MAKALWLEPTLNQTFAAMADHYDTTILPTRSRRPRDKGKVEGAVLIVERWILARLRDRRFFTLADLNAAIAVLLEDLNDRPMRHVGRSRRALFEEIERSALAGRAVQPFDQDRRVDADLVGFADQAGRRHVGITLMGFGHMLAHRYMAPALGSPDMARHPLVIVEQLHHPVGKPDIDLPPVQPVRDRVESLVDLDMIIGMDFGPFPFGIFDARPASS